MRKDEGGLSTKNFQGVTPENFASFSGIQRGESPILKGKRQIQRGEDNILWGNNSKMHPRGPKTFLIQWRTKAYPKIGGEHIKWNGPIH